MPRLSSTSAGHAWYSADRASFLDTSQDSIVATLSSAAATQGWHIEPQQHQEWDASVGILQDGIRSDVSAEIEILRVSLDESGLAAYSDVVLE